MGKRIKTILEHFMQYRALLRELIVRDLKIKYRNSLLGYLWSLLNPLMMMAVMTFIFSYMFRFDIPNYPLYLICGQTFWSFFNESTNMAMMSIISNSSLIKKVYLPKFIFPLSRVVSCFVTMLFSLMAIVVVMLFTKTVFSWTLAFLWIPLLFIFLFSLGVGLFLSGITVYFRDITHLYSVISMAWMYATPIFWPIELAPEFARNVLQYNPMYQIILCFREITLYGQLPTSGTLQYCIVSCCIAMAIGLLTFNKAQKQFILYL